jgi:hypothetical protein
MKVPWWMVAIITFPTCSFTTIVAPRAATAEGRPPESMSSRRGIFLKELLPGAP